MHGTVDRIWHNHRPDGTKYWVLSIDGQRYSVWTRDLIENIHPGDRVEFTFAQSGRYRNLLAVRKLDEPAFTAANSLARAPEWLRIVRMNCLRTAAELIKDANTLPERKVDLVMAAAERLEKHVRSPITATSEREQPPDKDPKQPKEGKDDR